MKSILKFFNSKVFMLWPMLLLAFQANSATWQFTDDIINLAEKLKSQQISNCGLISETKQLNDGYGTTPITLYMDNESLRVITESNLDMKSSVGLSVDNGEFRPGDNLHKETILIFNTQIEMIKEEFKRGLKASLKLRFWPTWPDTGAKEVSFSLVGFTKAIEEQQKCTQN